MSRMVQTILISVFCEEIITTYLLSVYYGYDQFAFFVLFYLFFSDMKLGLVDEHLRRNFRTVNN